MFELMKKFSYASIITALLGAGCGSLNIPNHPSDLPLLYHNAHYDFTFFLPTSWQGYSVLVQQWRGVTTERGPMIVLRHPQWKASDLYQDIPILVFTRSQWEADKQGRFTIGAGGFDEEIGHNPKYVFAISSRFNADDSVKGWKEAADIVERNQAANATHQFFASGRFPVPFEFRRGIASRADGDSWCCGLLGLNSLEGNGGNSYLIFSEDPLLGRAADDLSARATRHFQEYLTQCGTNEIRCVWFYHWPNVGIVMTLNLDNHSVCAVWESYNWAFRNAETRELTDSQVLSLQKISGELPLSNATAESDKAVSVSIRRNGKVEIFRYNRPRAPAVIQRIYDIGGGYFYDGKGADGPFAD